jgi:hypothetical protein
VPFANANSANAEADVEEEAEVRGGGANGAVRMLERGKMEF